MYLSEADQNLLDSVMKAQGWFCTASCRGSRSLMLAELSAYDHQPASLSVV